jgi:catechol 2,3-dioxygenase-like lactoylglutathione lyase family enzyme
MLDHTGIAVADFNRSKAFYQRALSPLSIVLVMEVTAEQSGGDAHAGFGTGVNRSSGYAMAAVWRVTSISLSPRGRAPRLTLSIARASTPEEKTMAHLGFVRTTTPTTMARSSSIRTATTSKPSVTSRCDGHLAGASR